MTAIDDRPVSPGGPIEGMIEVCRFDELLPERGVAALLPSGAQVAVFRTYDDQLYALENVDPFSGAAVLARGIVGDRAGVPVVVSPIYKQAFALSTGKCVDDDTVSVRVFQVKVVDGMVRVGSP
jgi:nitrite reductase (NADH) small subunit